MSSIDDKSEESQSFNELWSRRGENPSVEAESNSEPESQPMPESESTLSPMEAFEQLSETDGEETEETSNEDILAADMDSDSISDASLPSSAEESQDSNTLDIEEIIVKGPNGRKQKVKIDYSDRKAIKKAHELAAGMRKFQAERDARDKLIKPLETVFGQKITAEAVNDIVSLKNDFDKIESAFTEKGVKGIVELLGGGEDAWKLAVDEELSQRDYVNNLTTEEKYKLEMKKMREDSDKQLSSERKQREDFQQQIESQREQAEMKQLESKLHPAFERYRFAGKLGDTDTENLYDEAIWDQVRKRLAGFDDELELSQAMIDKQFREVSNSFRKHIKIQADKQFKKTVESKKAETAHRAQVAAKKGLGGSSQQRKIFESLKAGNLSNALGLWKQGK